MTQFEPGTVYDVAHLKPFDMKLALAGHPLASRRCESIRLFRSMSSNRHNFDYWDADDRSWISQFNLPIERLALELRLAPLAVKDGRALHVGDSIEIKSQPFGRLWQSSIVDNRSDVSRDWSARDWRWPKE